MTGEIVRGPSIDGEHALAVVVALHVLVAHLLLAHLDAVTLGHHLQRFGIGDVLVLHDEVDGVAALAAAEALVDASCGRDYERRRLLLMKRTACLIVDALAFERNILADDIDDIGGGIYPVYGFAIDHLRGILSCKDMKKKLYIYFQYCLKITKSSK